MNRRALTALLVACCLLLSGCLTPFTADESTSTPAPTATPDDRFDLRVLDDADSEVAVDVWFVTGRLEAVVVVTDDGSNATYAVDDLTRTPVAVENATSVTPRGEVDRSVGLRLSVGVDGTTKADVTDVESVVYAVSTGDESEPERTDGDGDGVRVGANETVQYVGVGTCSGGGVVTGLTLTLEGEPATAQVTCAG